MTQIAEAYFHIRPFDLDEARLNSLGVRASEIALEIAGGVFPPDSEISIRLSRGSLRGWAKIIGSALFVYSTVADYKGFKESVSELVSDAKDFAAAFNQNIISETGVGEAKVVRTERRLLENYCARCKDQNGSKHTKTSYQNRMSNERGLRFHEYWNPF